MDKTGNETSSQKTAVSCQDPGICQLDISRRGIGE